MGYGQFSSQSRPSKPSVPPKQSRLRHVFDSGTVPHVWAHPVAKDGSGYEQEHARNQQTNLYFKTSDDGTRTLFSYRDSYPIGSRFTRGTKVIFLTRSGKPYSVTTASHFSMCRNAVPRNNTSILEFEVPFVVRYGLTSTHIPYAGFEERNSAGTGQPDRQTHLANQVSYVVRINEAIEEFSRAHSLYSINGALERARKLTAEVKLYSKTFHIKAIELPAIPKLTAERKRKAEAFDAGSKARTDARYAARNARWQEQQRINALKLEERVKEWKAGNINGYIGNQDGYALLRVKGANVETSLGVEVPVGGPAGAARLLVFLLARKSANRPYQRNGEKQHIGQFVVDSFMPVVRVEDGIETADVDDWVLKAGCHKILWKEVEAIGSEVLRIDGQIEKRIREHTGHPHSL